MTAAALAKVLGPRLSITLVESSEIGIVGVGEATIPAIQQFNKLLKIDEDDFLRHAQGTFKLGIEFVDWFEKGQAYMHAFGPVGRDLAYVPFHHYFLKENAGSLWDYSLNWVAAKQARFARLERIADTPLAGLTWAFHFDASLYAAYLSKFAQALGVRRLDAKIAIDAPEHVPSQEHIELVRFVAVRKCPVEMHREAGILIGHAATWQGRSAKVVEWITLV